MREENSGVTFAELKIVQESSAAVVLREPALQTLVATLTPIADRLAEYKASAESLAVTDKATADRGALLIQSLKADIEIVKAQFADPTAKANALHKLWTGFQARFMDVMIPAGKLIRTKILAWEDEERRKAEAERARLQAIEDARIKAENDRIEAAARALREKEEAARAEQARLERLAQQAKSEAARIRAQAAAEEARKQAEATAAKAMAKENTAPKVAASVFVAPPKASGIRSGTWYWLVENIDAPVFLAAAARDSNLAGYIDWEKVKAALVKSKVANKALTVPGVTFREDRR